MPFPRIKLILLFRNSRIYSIKRSKTIKFVLFAFCLYRAAAASIAAQTTANKSTRKIPPPLLRSRTLPAIIVPGISILHTQLNPSRLAVGKYYPFSCLDPFFLDRHGQQLQQREIFQTISRIRPSVGFKKLKIKISQFCPCNQSQCRKRTRQTEHLTQLLILSCVAYHQQVQSFVTDFYYFIASSPLDLCWNQFPFPKIFIASKSSQL